MSEKKIYWKSQPGTYNNGFYRLNIDNLKENDYRIIDRPHNFKNKLTVCYKVEERIFVSLEHQELDPVELTPNNDALEAFENEDWEELERLFFNLE